ncbi:hypothetical protein NKDENANG_02497 [Candidatus Entotheonellaceae bacterium PAL068K]
MDVVRNQFFLLDALQELDERLRALRVEQHNLPEQLRPYQGACAEARQELTRLHQAIEQTEGRRRALERELDGLQTQLTKTQNKLREVKTNKEYSAVQTEIITGKEHIARLEDHVLDLMEKVEQDRQASQMQEQRVQEVEGALTDQDKEVERTHAVLAQQVEDEEEKRQRLVGDLQADLYATYQRLALLRDGQAVVSLQEGVCGGCYLTVQPQLISEIRQRDKLLTCPHCQRILLWPAE